MITADTASVHNKARMIFSNGRARMPPPSNNKQKSRAAALLSVNCNKRSPRVPPVGKFLEPRFPGGRRTAAAQVRNGGGMSAYCRYYGSRFKAIGSRNSRPSKHRRDHKLQALYPIRFCFTSLQIQMLTYITAHLRPRPRRPPRHHPSRRRSNQAPERGYGAEPPGCQPLRRQV